MTFIVQKSEQGEPVVQVTYGPIVIKVTEQPGHLRSFWGDLGRFLDEQEKSE